MGYQTHCCTPHKPFARRQTDTHTSKNKTLYPPGPLLSLGGYKYKVQILSSD